MAIITSIVASNLVSSLLWTCTYRNFVAPFALLASTQIHIRRNSHFSGCRNRGFSCKSSVPASIDVNSDATSIISSIGTQYFAKTPSTVTCFPIRHTMGHQE